MFVLAGVVGVVGFFSAVWGETVWPVCFAVPSAIALAVMAVYMLRRSRHGNELFAQYKAVHDYLHDFGRLHEVPPQSIVLWNRFLVLAVVFGIATEVINQLRVKVPAVVGDPAFQTTYWWVYAVERWELADLVAAGRLRERLADRFERAVVLVRRWRRVLGRRRRRRRRRRVLGGVDSAPRQAPEQRVRARRVMDVTVSFRGSCSTPDDCR